MLQVVHFLKALLPHERLLVTADLSWKELLITFLLALYFIQILNQALLCLFLCFFSAFMIWVPFCFVMVVYLERTLWLQKWRIALLITDWYWLAIKCFTYRCLVTTSDLWIIYTCIHWRFPWIIRCLIKICSAMALTAFSNDRYNSLTDLIAHSKHIRVRLHAIMCLLLILCGHQRRSIHACIMALRYDHRSSRSYPWINSLWRENRRVHLIILFSTLRLDISSHDILARMWTVHLLQWLIPLAFISVIYWSRLWTLCLYESLVVCREFQCFLSDCFFIYIFTVHVLNQMFNVLYNFTDKFSMIWLFFYGAYVN